MATRAASAMQTKEGGYMTGHDVLWVLAAFHMQKGLENSHDSREHNGQLTLVADIHVSLPCCYKRYGEIQPVPRQR
jgi:hypothetical protein